MLCAWLCTLLCALLCALLFAQIFTLYSRILSCLAHTWLCDRPTYAALSPLSAGLWTSG